MYSCVELGQALSDFLIPFSTVYFCLKLHGKGRVHKLKLKTNHCSVERLKQELNQKDFDTSIYKRTLDRKTK
jgi:hypothetical protein